jgi:CBS domain containing-hemolysin-like protein
MAHIFQNVGHIVLMLILLAFSAFFSGCETAFFNLSPRQINQLSKSNHRLRHLAARLVATPANLLGCLLFGNMIVNILFYASASILVIGIERQIGVTQAAVAAAAMFGILLLFGEILPKSFAYANSRLICIAAAVPVYLLVRFLAPVVFVFRLMIAEPIVRLMLGPAKTPRAITVAEFRALIEAGRQSGTLTADENKLLTEIVELGFLKVRDCLKPRVDMPICSVTQSPQQACEIMRQNQLTRLPVYSGRTDNIIGLVYLREILLNPDTALDKLVRDVNFVPEQKKIESLLEFFRSTGNDFAVAVDEYGGIAGAIELEDIAEELLGPFDISGEIEPIKQTGPFAYRLTGNLAIHDWARAFNIDPEKTPIVTVGGLVMTLLGKIPKPGDVARLKNLRFTVERVRKHRVETVILTLEPISDEQ